MDRYFLASTLALTTCLALAQPAKPAESASDLTKFVPAPPPAGAYSDSDNAPAGFLTSLEGPVWLDTARFPELTYRSTKVEATGPNTLRIQGELTLHGVTRPVVLNGTFNGGYSGHPMDPHARVGFSAHGAFKRSDFGVSFGLPPPGTQFGVGDEVEVTIETELSGPPYRAS